MPGPYLFEIRRPASTACGANGNGVKGLTPVLDARYGAYQPPAARD